MLCETPWGTMSTLLAAFRPLSVLAGIAPHLECGAIHNGSPLYLKLEHSHHLWLRSRRLSTRSGVEHTIVCCLEPQFRPSPCITALEHLLHLAACMPLPYAWHTPCYSSYRFDSYHGYASIVFCCACLGGIIRVVRRRRPTCSPYTSPPVSYTMRFWAVSGFLLPNGIRYAI
jgi:hypothetical protein